MARVLSVEQRWKQCINMVFTPNKSHALMPHACKLLTPPHPLRMRSDSAHGGAVPSRCRVSALHRDIDDLGPELVLTAAGSWWGGEPRIRVDHSLLLQRLRGTDTHIHTHTHTGHGPSRHAHTHASSFSTSTHTHTHTFSAAPAAGGGHRSRVADGEFDRFSL